MSSRIAKLSAASKVDSQDLSWVRFPAIMVIFAALGFGFQYLGLSVLMFSLLTQATITAILATSVGYLVRQCGLVSFGHAAFYGGAVYLLALGLQCLDWPPALILVGAPLVVVIAAFILAFLLLRAHGVAFSMLTLAVAQGCHELVMQWRGLANGEDGIAIDLPRTIFGIPVSIFQSPETMFLVCWVSLFIVLMLLWFLSRSHIGTLSVAIRENEERARFIGYETIIPRAFMIAVSAAVACVSGILFALYNGFVTPSVLDWSLSGEVLAVALIGGARQVWGPALGAFVFFVIRDVAGDYTDHWQGIVGLLLILVMLTMPGGLSGALTSMVTAIKGSVK